MVDSENPVTEFRDDEEFITYLYDEFYRLMFYVAGLYISDPHDKEDIVQDCITNLMEKSDVLREMTRKEQRNYIYATAKHTAINCLKHNKVIEKHTVTWEDWKVEQDISEQFDHNPNDRLLIEEQKAQLIAVWDKLSERDRSLLRGKYIEKLTNEELAGRLGCQPNSIRTFLCRARDNARRLMSELTGGEVK